jgi:diguanylate cyclase (GGDEF)-like protein/putative nucleotidyltransferase with HDIG domain
MGGTAPKHESGFEIALRRFITLAGLVVFAYSVFELIESPPGFQWVWLSVVTVLVVSRLDIHIPKTCGTITLSDTFVFISLALYGILPSVVLAGVDGAAGCLQHRERRRAAPFKLAIMSLSIFISATIASRTIGSFPYSASAVPQPTLVMSIGFVALLHYLLSAGVSGAIEALGRAENRIRAWCESLLWSSISYFVGAVAACLIVELLTVVSLYEFLIAIPVLACTYLTYKSHLDRVEASFDHADRMGDLQLRTIEALAVAIEAKEEGTQDHARRLQIYATGLAEFFGLSEPEIEALKVATILHDIGKIAIPDHILNKPGPLSPEEFERMKQHTVVGADILDRVGFPYPVVPVVLHQHERWDGQGYPDGLRADQIPIGARILSLVDCFDSLKEDRKYRKAKSRGEAIAILKEAAGTTFDPEVVRVFLEHLPEFETEIRRQRVDIQPASHRQAGIDSVSGPRREAATGNLDRLRAHRDVVALYDIAETVAATLDLRDALAVFSSRLADIVPFTTCVLYLLRPESADIEVAHASGRNFDRIKGRRVPVGSGIAGWVIGNRQPIFNGDPRLDFDALKIDVAAEYKTSTVVPLLKDDHMLGALGLYSADMAAYESDDLRLVEAVAKVASDALAKALQCEVKDGSALADSLTGLPNARALRHRFEEEADRARRHSDGFSVVMLDVDGLKSINHQLGHEVGDSLLRDLGRLFASHVRSSDFVTRYAGDEFVAILQAGPEEALDLARRLQRLIDQKDFGQPPALTRVGISVGCSSFGADGISLDELLIAADRAMLADKARRKAAVARSQDTGKLFLDQYRIM